jgi:LacI family transcriptional regulator, galactose operon repressor
MDRAARPKISDVALRAGVSTATVSRVLAGIGRARPDTAASVVAAAEALGYRPSGVARSLRMQRTRTLGLIVSDVQNPFFPELVRAADDAARAIDYSILLGSAAFDEMRAVHYLNLMVDRRVDGMIVASSQISAASWSWLIDSPVPVIVVNAEAPDARVATIASDNEGGSKLAVAHLVGLGHRRIGYIRGPESFTAAEPRLDGFRMACVAAGLDPKETPVLTSDGQVEGGALIATQMIGQMPWVTAIVGYNDLTAIGALRALRGVGRRVPEDVSVIGFDDIAAASWVVPGLTTIVQQKAEMGRLAVEYLVRALEVNSALAEVIRLPTLLRERESTGPAPGSTSAGSDVPG